MSIKIGRLIKTLGVTAVIVAAVTLSALRLLLPHIPSYRDEVETWLSLRLGHPVNIGAMSAQLQGLGAALRFTDVTLLDQARGLDSAQRLDQAPGVDPAPLADQPQRLPLFSFREVVVKVDLWHSLLTLRPQFGPLTLVGVELEVAREADGSLHVAGMPAVSGAGVGADKLGLGWLLDRDYISLVNSSVRWRDNSRGRNSVLTFSNLRLAVIKAGKRHRIGGEIGLPQALGNSLTFMLDANGDLRDGSQWSGTGYVRGQGLRLAPLRALLTTINVPAVEGVLNSEVWVNWRAGSVVSTLGSVQIRAPVIHGGLARWDAAAALAHFNWRVVSGGWLLNVSRWQVDSAAAAGTPGAAWVVRRTGGAKPVWEIAANQVQLQPIGRIALAANLLNAEQREAMHALQIQGQVNDAYMRVTEDRDDQPFYLRGTFNDVGFRPWRKLPGASGLDGSVEANSRAAMVHVKSERAQIDVPRLFREPLRIDRLTGDMVARKQDASWTVWSERVELSNADVSAEGSFQLHIPRDGSPDLDLAANFRNGQATATSRYLPVGVLPVATVAWLDRAIVAGTVPAGGVVFRGPLDQFPFSRAQGRFEVRFAVEDGVLDYAARWPRLEQLYAEVVFSEHSMRIRGQRARILDAAITDVEVGIEELSAHRSVLHVKGRGDGPAATGLAFLTTTPLGDTVGQRLRGWKGDGPIGVELDMKIPLRAGANNDVAGTIRFDGAELISDDAQVDVRALRGELRFDHEGIRGNALSATVLSQPALVDVKTSGDGTVWFNGAGTTSGAALAERFSADILRGLHGPLSWRGSLRLPHRNAGAPAEVQIHSDLQNVMINAPYPLGKGSMERRDSEVKILLDNAGAGEVGIIPINVRYGNNVSAVLALHRQQAQWRPQRADVRIGRGPAHMPTEDGIHLFARLDKLDVDAWRELVLPASANNSIATESASASALALREADFEVGQVQWLSRRFNEVHIGVMLGPDAWNVDVSSDTLSGTVMVPQRVQDPVVIDLTRLYLNPMMDRQDPATEASKSKIAPPWGAAAAAEDPRLGRGFRLTADDFRYGEWALGRMQLRAQPVTEGLRFDQVKFGDGPTAISAHGSWLWTPSGATSRWHVEMRSADMGRTLTGFGYANTMRGGLGTVGFDLNWTGGPAQFTLRGLDGEINIDSTQGRLLEVEPGAGRIFGLLSLQALPRRLDLDFSDLFAKGFAFDHIGGKFVLTQGVAKTSDMVMEGPAAVVQVSGSVNLVEKTYDHRVKVLPKVTSSLPLAVGVAATPLAGAAAWLAEKILRDPLSDLAQANYRVTGPWQSPLVERISRETPQYEEDSNGGSSSQAPPR